MKSIRYVLYAIFGLVLIGVFLFFISADEETVLSHDDFLIIAHRGASAYAPEHTIESYKLANEMGADYIELDLQMTKDNEIIVMHDSSVDRTTNGTGNVADMTLDEIKKLDAGSWFNEENPDFAKSSYIGLKVPTLEEVLGEFGSDVNYYIETKKPDKNIGMEEKLIDILDKHNLIDSDKPNSKVIIQSFSLESLELVHEINPNIPLVLLQGEEAIKGMNDEVFEEISTFITGVGPHFIHANEEYINKALNHGLLIHPFTVDNSLEIDKLKEQGATGVFTNDLSATEVIAQ